MLLTLRGTPTIYYGDEIGMMDMDIPSDAQADPWGRRRPGLGRDGCRTPMQWTAEANAGFSDQAVSTWLPIHTQHREHNVAAELGDKASHLELYRRLLRLRRSQPSLQVGSIELADSPERTLVYRRGAGGTDAIVVALNLSEEPAEVVDLSGTILVGTRPESDGSPFSGHLAPWEGVVLKV
jgi:alpha-glucosidase